MIFLFVQEFLKLEFTTTIEQELNYQIKPMSS